MFGICVAVKATTSTSSWPRKTTLKLWKSRPAAPTMRTRFAATPSAYAAGEDGTLRRPGRLRAVARFVDALNEQIGREFAASQQYVAIAVYYDSETLPQLSAHFYRQAVEERNHAMMIVQYLLDAGEGIAIPGVGAPRSDFGGAVAPVALALEQERQVTDQIKSLASLARDEGELVGEQFLSWFLTEQLEETS